MDFHVPSDLEPFEVLFDRSEPNPALPPALVQFAGSLAFPSRPPTGPGCMPISCKAWTGWSASGEYDREAHG